MKQFLALGLATQVGRWRSLARLGPPAVSRKCFFRKPTNEFFVDQARVVQRMDNAIHRINRYPADSVVCFVNTYPLDSDLSGG